MKIKTHFKTVMMHAALAAVFSFMASCSNNNKPEDTKEVAEDHNEAKFDDKDKEKDAEFLVNAAEINMEEIKLGQLAQKMGTTAHVKELGKMMEDAHSKAMGDLKNLADKKMVTLPASDTEDAIDAYNKLSEKKGKDFDKAYCDMMVDGHEKAIKKFEKASTDANDPDVRAWATTMLPELRSHLDHAMNAKNKTQDMK